MITALIFSKSRPMQLDLLLRSLEKNAPKLFDIQVLVKITHEYKDSYAKLAARFENVTLFNENDFTKDLNYLINKRGNPFLTFFTDDCIFYRKFKGNQEDISDVMEDKDVVCVSMRLGTNIVQENYWDHSPTPTFDPKCKLRGFCLYNAHSYSYNSAFGYKFSVDGHIFRRWQIALWIQQLGQLSGPNSLEGSLGRFKDSASPPIMACPQYSHVVAVPVNRVQDVCPNRAGCLYPFPPQELNERYMRNEVVDLDALNLFEIKGTHEEIPLFFKKYE